jgi:hypothetical protein
MFVPITPNHHDKYISIIDKLSILDTSSAKVAYMLRLEPKEN